MTDKQIIDGVDVNECAYFLYPLGCNSLDSKTCQCINDDCYYKNYKRKEQECEELKAENNTYKSSIVANLDKSISKRYRELLEENDQLKETIEDLLSIQYKLADNNKQLRQTLAEIKEIAEEKAKVNDWLALEILEKINEVE